MATQDQSIEDLIQAISEGGQYDSSGHFTMARDRALFKLGQHQLPRPEAWLTKVIQAAVADDADGLTIKQKRAVTQLDYQAEGEGQLRDLEQVLSGSQSDTSRAFQHLAIALRALMAQPERHFRVSWGGRSGREMLEWDGTALRHSGSSPSGAGKRSLRLLVDFPREDPGRALAGLMRGTGVVIKEYDEVARTGLACPIPLKLDGRLMNRLEPPRKRTSSLAREVLLWLETAAVDPPLARRPLALPSGLEVGGVWTLGSRADSTSALLRSVWTELQKQPSGFSISRFSHHFEPRLGQPEQTSRAPVATASSLHWVQDGAVIESEEIELLKNGCVLDLFLTADGLQTDLTTFGLPECEEKERRRTLGLIHATWAMGNLLEQRPRSSSEVAQLVLKGTGFSGLAAGMAALKVFANPIGLPLVLGGFGAVYVSDKMNARVTLPHSEMRMFYTSLRKLVGVEALAPDGEAPESASA